MFKDGLKNMAWGLSQQWIGGSQVMWLQEHVVLHHMHTGDVHMDPDAQMAPVRSRRPAVLRRLHAIDARRLQARRSWVVDLSISGPFGPHSTEMLRAGPRVAAARRRRFTKGRRLFECGRVRPQEGQWTYDGPWQSALSGARPGSRKCY